MNRETFKRFALNAIALKRRANLTDRETLILLRTIGFTSLAIANRCEVTVNAPADFTVAVPRRNLFSVREALSKYLPVFARVEVVELAKPLRYKKYSLAIRNLSET